MPSSFLSLQGPDRQHRHEGNLKYIDSDSTQSTQSLSESEDDILWGPEDAEQQPPLQEQEQETLVSILRRKVKLGTDTDTKTTDTNNRGRVRFEQGTKFLDPNARPSSTRKHIPRMLPQQ